MAALLAGARLILRQGVRQLSVYTRRPAAVPVRCLSSSSRLFTVVAREKGSTEYESSPVSRVRQWQEGWSIHLMGSELKRSGRISKVKLLGTFEDVCKTGQLSSNQAWFFLRACGSFMPEVPLVERTELADNIWDKLKELGVELNITHYNTLLNVYVQNEHVFSPTEFLANMEAANVEPDQGTYQGLIAAYCSKGDIDGASKILGFMKSKNFPITENVFNSLIKGHARAGDMESAKNVLSIMKNAGVEPRWSSHVALLNAYAEKGDIESVKQILNDSEINVPQKQLASVILALAKSGYSQYVPDVLEHMPSCISFSQDTINLCLTLLTQGYEDAALDVAKQLSAWKPSIENSESQPGDFFLRHCVNLKMPIDILMKCVDQLLAAEMHNRPKEFLLQCALRNFDSDYSMQLIKVLKVEGILLRSRNFSPVLAQLHNRKDLQGLIEILRIMKTMGVNTDLDVLTRCMSWVFSEANSGHPLLQDKECVEDLNHVCQSALRYGLFTGHLKKVHHFLSSSNAPILKDKLLLVSLANSFLKYRDVEMLAKITGLLYKDGSDSKESSRPTDFVDYFLYYLIDRMSYSEAQAMEEHLRQYFHQLKEMGLTVDTSHYRGIQKLLERNGVTQLNEDLEKLLKSGESFTDELVENIAALEEELANLEKENKPIKTVLVRLLHNLHAAKDLPKALQLKSKYEDSFTSAMYTKLLLICCEENNAQEALKVKRELDQKGFTTVPSSGKYVALLKVLTENGLIEDAINILKEMLEKDVPINESTSYHFFNILNNLALKGETQAVGLLHECSVMLGLISPNSNMCSPLVMVHLKKDDLPAALNALSECIEKYKCVPLVHEVLSTLVEKGETDLLRKAVDRLSDFIGEQPMLHELFFAFIRAGKYSEAEKIAETPGLRTYPGKMNWFAERCLRTNQVELWEKCIEYSKKIFDCDREEMYFQLFKMYDKTKDWEKAKNAWYKMQEENVVPRETTLSLVQSIFEKNGQNITNEIPEFESKITVRGSTKRVNDLCREGKITEAFAAFQEATQNNVRLSAKTYSSLIDALMKGKLRQEAFKVAAVAKNHIRNFSLKDTASNLLIEEQVRRDCLKDAVVTLQTMLENGTKPVRSSMGRLILALGLSGDVPSLEKVKELSEHYELPTRVMPEYLSTCVTLAHLRNGNLEDGISSMESLCINEPKKSFTFFLIKQLMHNNMEEALEKVSILVERLANQFADYVPATNLFVNYVIEGREEDARHLLQRCSAITEQRGQLCHHIIKQMARNEEEKATRLAKILSDPLYMETLYSYKMRGYQNSKKIDEAVALYEQAKAEHVEPGDLFLKRLAVLLRDAGKPVPFSEPPESLEYYLEQLKKQTPEEKEKEE